MSSLPRSSVQQTTLVMLRTLIGWHFLCLRMDSLSRGERVKEAVA
jgi:hypothetical protein